MARTSPINTPMELTCDGLHADIRIGRYLLACVVFENLLRPIFGISCLGNTYRDTAADATGNYAITDERALVAQKIAIWSSASRGTFESWTNIPIVSQKINRQ